MPLPDHAVRDPRIKRTRQLLQGSLRQLLQQKPFDEILVQDITSAATVNRATFYDHYTDKLDLFNALIASDFQTLLDQRGVCFEQGDAAGLTAIVMAVSDFLAQLHSDHAKCSRQANTGPLIDGAISLAVCRIVQCRLEEQRGEFALPESAMAALVSGAIYNGVKQTMAQSNGQAGEAALRSVVQVVLPLLKPAA